MVQIKNTTGKSPLAYYQDWSLFTWSTTSGLEVSAPCAICRVLLTCMPGKALQSGAHTRVGVHLLPFLPGTVTCPACSHMAIFSGIGLSGRKVTGARWLSGDTGKSSNLPSEFMPRLTNIREPPAWRSSVGRASGWLVNCVQCRVSLAETEALCEA